MTDDPFGQKFDYEHNATLIAEFAEFGANDPKFADFFDYNDIGIPLAQLVLLGQIEQLSSEGEASLDETYQNLCDLFSKDSDDHFDSLDDLMA
jgi:hypothetical protein